ncbi:MAG TPA: hypothetical protein VGK30_19645 [Candidatus Binatia bacterium]
MHAVGIQTDGKIVAAGSSLLVSGGSSALALARYAADGTLDPSFGTGGLVTSNPGLNSATALVIQSDGKLVVSGDSLFCCKLSVARYLPSGTLDSTFGLGGVASAAVPNNWFVTTNAMVQQSDGKFVVAGAADSPDTANNQNFVLARFNVDGTLDTSFGSNGASVTDIAGSEDNAFALALQKDGKIVAAGYATTGATTDFAVARYGTDGTLDTSFGVGGKVTTAFGTTNDQWDRAFAVVVQKSGDIVAVGTAHDDVALARYLSNGTLDTSFLAGSGTVTTDVAPGLLDEGLAALLTPGGSIVVAGSFGGLAHFGLARYMGNEFILWHPRNFFVPNVFDPRWRLKYNPVALLAGNALYMPAKIGFAAVGALAGSIAYVATIGNAAVARSIWRTSLGGDYAITPTLLASRESPRFVGGTRPSAPGMTGAIVTVASQFERIRNARRTIGPGANDRAGAPSRTHRRGLPKRR